MRWSIKGQLWVRRYPQLYGTGYAEHPNGVYMPQRAYSAEVKAHTLCTSIRILLGLRQQAHRSAGLTQSKYKCVWCVGVGCHI